jgi:hypothetical protein
MSGESSQLVLKSNFPVTVPLTVRVNIA